MNQITTWSRGIVIALLLTGICFAIQSCQNNSEDTTVVAPLVDETFKPLPPVITNEIILVGDIQLPVGTIIDRSGGADDLVFKFPGNYRVVAQFTDAESPVLLEKLGYRCTCTQGSGCDVVSAGGHVGCDHLKSCTGSCNGRHTFDDLEINGEILGLLNLEKGVRLVNTDERGDQTIPVEKLLALDEVHVAIGEFYKKFYDEKTFYELGLADAYGEGKIDMDNHAYFPVSIYGETILMYLPKTRITKAAFSTEGFESVSLDAVSCKCNAGEAGCKLVRSFTHVKCESGNCTDCEMLF